ncbi:phosphoribosylformylglycinamidine synthase subunit PurQ [Magnetospira sp. QH-2]|uniref:phosphoribosylformylglycinamidine synthase subunit PurQ n=1 Tax=Magnetospira sp. (strain QH-2) TaxID=1288970 RepID=UPI0003E80E36|nr:phosphoribosylformylglycinamidine synthase subunit PurQ [Magnetospira sp. QH-2]CCQ72891.1 phosphoribosylformylglycinamidine synthase, purQ subunit [Magnetospira sp. QH-2]
MKAAVIVFPGSNCDRDMQVSLRNAMGEEPRMVWHRDTELPDVDLIAVPGGFSYGDYLRCGAMASHSPIMAEVKKAAERGVHVLGVCNGFQVLTEAGLLPGALMRNRDIKFLCRDVWLSVEKTDGPFTTGYEKGEVIRIPVAHHDGNYFTDEETLKRVEGNGQVAFRYCSADGTVDDTHNPNGSCNNIAGLTNQRGNVLGMMPHPERLADPALGGTDGRAMFEGLVGALG